MTLENVFLKMNTKNGGLNYMLTAPTGPRAYPMNAVE